MQARRMLPRLGKGVLRAPGASVPIGTHLNVGGCKGAAGLRAGQAIADSYHCWALCDTSAHSVFT